ncbi:MAG: aldo/keto reductase [Bacteroidetes bacterium]|jgi:2,5-diketo-D-gluconate reductase B|nr:aldo/keto reductase [Bacteroidota bacterium]
MIHRTIRGIEIPALGLGTWQLTGDACTEGVEHALDLGYRHIDTAQAYENEDQVGTALRNTPVDRDEIYLTTKVWVENLVPAAVRRSTEASLRRLGTDYVDLLLIHWPSTDVPLERTLDAMMVLRDEGKTREVGVSNFTPSLVRRALDHAPILCNQVEYHPFLDQDALLDLAEARDLLLTAYSPLARGRVMEDETMQAIAEAHGKTPAQVALRWLLQQDQVAAIPKASTAAHREANVDVFDFALSEDEMDRIFDLAGDERLIDPSFAPAW